MFRQPQFGPCRACGYEPVERSASTCPNCGVRAPRRTPAMLAAGVAFAIVVLLAFATFVFFMVTTTDDSPTGPPDLPTPEEETG